jgi:hypothetical protein
MLKTVSSITNAIGALNYKGTWDASTNTPTLTSGAGTKGDYYQVSVAGSTALDGISNWGVGDVAAFNGATWQRIEGGADLNGVNLSVSGTTSLGGLTASTALALDASKNVVSVANTGTGNNVLATSPSIATPTLTGNATVATLNNVGIKSLTFSGGASTYTKTLTVNAIGSGATIVYIGLVVSGSATSLAAAYLIGGLSSATSNQKTLAVLDATASGSCSIASPVKVAGGFSVDITLSGGSASTLIVEAIGSGASNMTATFA